LCSWSGSNGSANEAGRQAIASGDDRYSPGRRAELIGPETAPLAVEAGPVIFGELNTRFTELVGLLLGTVARLRAYGSRIVIQRIARLSSWASEIHSRV
jgi:hypothetical protein